MTRRSLNASAIFLAFIILFFIVAFSLNSRHPVLVIAGEDSPATWLSGAMLVMAATLSGVIAFREGWFPWILLTVFFFLLAIDERFMIHESLKDRILFSSGKDTPLWFKELPVIIGAFVGLIVSVVFSLRMDRTGRILLSITVFFGLASVVWDIFSMGVVPEEISKLIAETVVCIALLDKIGKWGSTQGHQKVY
jgi:hypothetical protein